MRSMLFATVATFGLTFGVAAMAQTTNDDMAPPAGHMPASGRMPVAGHMPGDGLSQPASSHASNITPGDTRSTIAPRLPGSEAAGTETTASQQLNMAQQYLNQHRTGAAQEALERAETRILDRSTPAGMTGTPSMNPVTQTISQARDALGRNDLAGARSLIAKAIAQQTAG